MLKQVFSPLLVASLPRFCLEACVQTADDEGHGQYHNDTGAHDGRPHGHAETKLPVRRQGCTERKPTYVLHDNIHPCTITAHTHISVNLTFTVLCMLCFYLFVLTYF